LPLISASSFPFFFHSSVDLRDLHSFPTRRSSDLFRLLPAPDRLACPAHHTPQEAVMTSLIPRDTFFQDLFDFRRDFDQILEESIDRKSTRLNSSHVAISYAVFCLKKKKHR